MVKIKVSYARPEELREVLKSLGSKVMKCKIVKNQNGPRHRAYIELKD